MKRPQPATKRSPTKTAIIKEVIKLEKLVWKVAQDRDAQSFAELVPSDAIMIFQSGVMTQPAYVKTMKQRTIARYKLSKIQGFMPTDSTVILLYEALRIGRERNKKFPVGRVVESTTWVRRGGRWVAVLNEETPQSK
jgi:hypothetical protein